LVFKQSTAEQFSPAPLQVSGKPATPSSTGHHSLQRAQGSTLQNHSTPHQSSWTRGALSPSEDHG